jgi:hypothetical protein
VARRAIEMLAKKPEHRRSATAAMHHRVDALEPVAASIPHRLASPTKHRWSKGAATWLLAGWMATAAAAYLWQMLIHRGS